MKKNHEETYSQQPQWVQIALPFASLFLAALAFWYTWSKYTDLINAPEVSWLQWAPRLSLIAVAGLLFLGSAVLYLLNRQSSWSAFIAGLYMVPVILFVNLIVFLMVLTGKLFGNANGVISGAIDPFWENLSMPSPRAIVIQSVIILIAIGFFVAKHLEKQKN
ncbi:hypothetical protein [Planococcus sp. YIM B11945]|uniref:hypothetical protein n=1 Tax=Planococcus sp. YIM B11945 TaxID=3435410 RepID=UPI003D7D7D5F